MIRAVIFDCFGVLLNDSLDAALDEKNANEDQRRAVWDVVKAANRGLISAEEARRMYADILHMSYEDWAAMIARNEVRNESLFAYILELKRSYKTGLLSNVASGGLRRRFREGELEKYFDCIAASGEIGFAKPDPKAYIFTLNQLGVEPSDAIFVDDREEYCAGAQFVGMKTIHYQSFRDFKAELEKLLRPDSNT